MLKFVTKTPRDVAKDKIKWVQVVKRPGTTALIDTPREAKAGMFITHGTHKKVMLINMLSPGELTVKLLLTDEHVVVDADDCGPPFSAGAKVTSAFTKEGLMANLCHLCGCANILLPWILLIFGRGHKLSAKAVGKQPAQAREPQITPPKKKGRPMGSKDKQPRQPKTIHIAWVYGGRKGAGGMQFGAIGQHCTHDIFGEGYILQQPNESSLVMQFGDGDDAALSTVDATNVQGIAAAAVVEGVTGSSSVMAPRYKTQGKRHSGLTRKKSSIVQAPTSAIQKRATKAEVLEVKKRKRREATAAARGKPLKQARERKNKKWDAALKLQAVNMYHSKYTTGSNFDGCAKELSHLPGFEGISRGHVQGWVSAAVKLTAQEPNEFGLVIYEQGRPPALPEAMYNELKEQLIKLVNTKAFTMTSTTLRPIALGYIVNKLGVEAIRPGQSRFSCSYSWMKRLAHASSLKHKLALSDHTDACPSLGRWSTLAPWPPSPSLTPRSPMRLVMISMSKTTTTR